MSDEKKAYSDLLRDPRWQQKRLRIFERDGWQCRRCGDSSSELQVDHRYYVRGKKPWEYEDDALQTLCAPCHLAISEERGQVAGGRPWRVMRGGPVDLIFDDETGACVGWEGEPQADPFILVGVDMHGAWWKAFCRAAYGKGLGLSFCAKHTGSPKFFLAKETNNGTTYIVARAGDESAAMRIVADTGVDCGGNWERIA